MNKWTIVQMEAYPEYNGQPDIVFTVHWNLVGTQDTYQGSVYGSTGLTLSEEATFIPYAALTEEQVIGWVKEALGDEQVASYESSVAQQIEAQINPTAVKPPLPW